MPGNLCRAFLFQLGNNLSFIILSPYVGRPEFVEGGRQSSGICLRQAQTDNGAVALREPL